jgi:hypothetical protein
MGIALSASIFDPGAHGYCQFMHTPWDVDECDAVHDPGRENDWGGEYGPYVLERFTRADPTRSICTTSCRPRIPSRPSSWRQRCGLGPGTRCKLAVTYR